MNYTEPPIHLITDKARADITAWNAWRSKNLNIPVILDGVDLSGRGLGEVDLRRVGAMDVNFGCNAFQLLSWSQFP